MSQLFATARRLLAVVDRICAGLLLLYWELFIRLCI